MIYLKSASSAAALVFDLQSGGPSMHSGSRARLWPNAVEKKTVAVCCGDRNSLQPGFHGSVAVRSLMRVGARKYAPALKALELVVCIKSGEHTLHTTLVSNPRNCRLPAYVSFLFAPPRMSNSSLFVLPLIGAPSSFILIRPYSCLIGYLGIKTSVPCCPSSGTYKMCTSSQRTRWKFEGISPFM